MVSDFVLVVCQNISGMYSSLWKEEQTCVLEEAE
jgi:hypothetical protein